MQELEKSKLVAELCHKYLYELPENAFELYSEYQDLIEVFGRFLEYIQKKSDELLEDIEHNNLTDPVYEVVYPVKRIRKVNLEKLQESFPQVYEKLAFIESNKLSKLVSKKDMMEFVLSKNENAVQYITVNLTDLEKVLDKSEAVGVIDSTDTRVPKPVVAKRDSYEKDHYKLGSDEVTRVYVTST